MNPLLTKDRVGAIRTIGALSALTVLVLLLWPGLLSGLFSDQGFMPHGHCYFWTPGLVWLHFCADLVIALSYFAISTTLALLLYRSSGGIPFPTVFLAFGIFIVACGSTHAIAVVTIWQPVYWISGSMKLITAVASLATAILLPPLVPRVTRLVEDARLSSERQTQLLEARQERDAAEAANRAKDQFLATLSHELRTPMTSIIGWATMLKGDLGTEEEIREAVDAILVASRNQTRLIEDLLDVSRIVSGMLMIRNDEVDLDLVVNRAIDTVAHLVAQRDVHLEIEGAGQGVSIWGDADRMQQVLVNLLSNAIKFSHPGGRVALRILRNEHSVLLSVKDEGVGIEPEFLPRIFDRFSQEDGTSTRSHGGLGLGLAITQRIVELHGGTIEARSPGREQGAEFLVELPFRPSNSPDDVTAASS